MFAAGKIDEASKKKKMDALQEIFNGILGVIVGTPTGAMRLESLLLALLLTSIDNNPLGIDPSIAGGIYLWNTSSPGSSGGNYLGFGISNAAAISNDDLSIAEDYATIDDQRNQAEQLKKIMIKKASGDEIGFEDQSYLTEAYKELAITVVHELSHTDP
ncbi:hypothetical protein FACS189449_11140 [Alphaproteobacteria bacterium]|nr:hypothetical protein FACS189449_11140 [Alphaproteobacteria bacterium]